MKILKRRGQVTAASGTVKADKTKFYKLTLEELLDILRDNDRNIITIWQLETDEFRAIDFKRGLWGSGVVDDYLYICDTDGADILVNGQATDPEEVINMLADGDIDEAAIADYVAEPDEKYICRWMSPDEMNQPDFEDAALALLQTPFKYTLQQIVNAAEEYDSFERI